MDKNDANVRPAGWLRKWRSALNPYVPEDLQHDGVEPVRVEESRIRQQAGLVVVVVFAIFLYWSMTAPLDSGAVAEGTVVVFGSRKAVQYPASGVVEEILVKEGAEVKKGDLLLRINPLSVDANLTQAENELINALASYSRLIAERTGVRGISWDAGLVPYAGRRQVIESKLLQEALFRSRQDEYLGTLAILARQVDGLKQQITEKKEMLRLRKSQIAPLVDDAESMRKLSNDGFVPRTKANDAERTASDAQAGIASLQSDIAATVTSLAATELQLSQTRSTYMKQVDTELADAQKQKDTLKSRVISLQFDKSLAQVRAPTEGIVVGSKANTVGGVIAAGQVIMEIVPREERLVVEARIPPYLIDKVAVGLDADIRFDAFNTYTTPVIPGVVRLVGADLMPPLPPQTSSEYFLAQIEVTQDGMKLLKEKKIRAGMPATVIVKNGERPFLSYLLKPLADRFATSFKEYE